MILTLKIYKKIQIFIAFFSFTAHMNKMDKQASDETCQLPKKSVPLSTEDDLRREMPSVVKGTFHRITQDKFHQRPCSKYGQTMILISQQLLAVQLTILHMLLISSIVPMFSSSTDFSSSRFLLCVNKLRDDPDFIESMIDFILTNINFELELRLAKMYAQRFLTCFTTTYFHRQLQLLDVQQQMDNAVISKNDKEVLFYICGYILHALKKRYLKSKVKHSDLLNMLEHLFSNDQKRNDYSEWTDKLDRGGLKRPGEKFFRLIVQIERWVRDVVSIPNLHTNSLVNLKEKLCDYALLRSSWDCMIEDTDIKKWLMLDHVVSLFVKVRGFAVTKLVRKQLQKKRKDAKVTAGSRKALRKELRNLSNPK